jgi:carboxyl-terminal processing protease
MKSISKFFFIIFLVLGLSSCEKLTEVSAIKDGKVTGGVVVPPSNNGRSNETVNSWVYDVMDIFYLWGDKMPTKTASNQTLDPDKYFESLLYQYGTTDRFSWIEEDAEALRSSLQGVTKSSGFSYSTFRVTSGDGVVLAVRFVIKNSPAEKAGIKRGDLITKINGTDLTTQNFAELLSGESLVFTLGERSGTTIASTSKTISVTKATIQNYPVNFTSIIDAGTKKVGYIVYNQFIPGITTGNTNDEQFDNELRKVFGEFKTAGVNELVLDLRFNGGGFISSSEVLSSLIVKNLSPGTLMNREMWSANGEQYARRYWGYTDSDFYSNWANEPNNLAGLNRVFVLVSGGTASASELVINNLKPHMEVILIGANTYGKDVGSITLDDSGNNYRWKWGLQPIVLRTVNSEGKADYGTKDGFKPDFAVTDNIIPFLPFGDPNETLLKVALQQIGGTLPAAKARVQNALTLPLIESLGGFDNPRNNIKDMYVDRK